MSNVVKRLFSSFGSTPRKNTFDCRPGVLGAELRLHPNIRRAVRSKRIIDSLLIMVGLPVLLPVGLLTALSIRLIDGAPILFRQTRLGFQEREFELLKFRTMTAGDGRSRDAHRITSLGAVLRKTSLDEIPQLINILRGEMSLVGPRPLYVEYREYYSERERLRHMVRPGITGNAQVRGRNSVRWRKRLEFDVSYVENLSTLNDFVIIALTVKSVLRRDGVSLVAGETGEPLHIERSYPCEEGARLRRLDLLDVDTRVTWMSDSHTAKYMQLPEKIDRESTISWLRKVREDAWRDDFVVVNDSDESINAMLGLKSAVGSPIGVLYIFTDPRRQGVGLGRQAMRLLLSWARKSRYETIELTVDKSNVAAVKLYESLGFRMSAETVQRREYKFDLRDND